MGKRFLAIISVVVAASIVAAVLVMALGSTSATNAQQPTSNSISSQNCTDVRAANVTFSGTSSTMTGNFSATPGILVFNINMTSGTIELYKNGTYCTTLASSIINYNGTVIVGQLSYPSDARSVNYTLYVQATGSWNVTVSQPSFSVPSLCGMNAHESCGKGQVFYSNGTTTISANSTHWMSSCNCGQNCSRQNFTSASPVSLFVTGSNGTETVDLSTGTYSMEMGNGYWTVCRN